MAKAPPKAKEIDQRLVDYTYQFLEDVMSNTQSTVTDKARALDRATRLEALKQKVGENYGSGLFDDEDDEDPQSEPL